MNNIRNQVQLIGRLGRDAETHRLDDGKVKTKLVISTNDSWSGQDEDQVIQKTQWHDVVAWNSLAELLSNSSKGDKIAVQGRLNYRTYEDGNGISRYIAEIVATNVLFINQIS
jgi:single-strand DNA-binding protein